MDSEEQAIWMQACVDAMNIRAHMAPLWQGQPLSRAFAAMVILLIGEEHCQLKDNHETVDLMIERAREIVAEFVHAKKTAPGPSAGLFPGLTAN